MLKFILIFFFFEFVLHFSLAVENPSSIPVSSDEDSSSYNLTAISDTETLPSTKRNKNYSSSFNSAIPSYAVLFVSAGFVSYVFGIYIYTQKWKNIIPSESNNDDDRNRLVEEDV